MQLNGTGQEGARSIMGYGYRDMWKPYSLGWFLERIHLVTIFNSGNVKFGLRDPETI